MLTFQRSVSPEQESTSGTMRDVSCVEPLPTKEGHEPTRLFVKRSYNHAARGSHTDEAVQEPRIPVTWFKYALFLTNWVEIVGNGDACFYNRSLQVLDKVDNFCAEDENVRLFNKA